MEKLLDLPPELLDQILLELDALDVASVAQTCSELRSYIDDPEQRLWRKLYLTECLDDPRQRRTNLGQPLPPEINWKTQLLRSVRARTFLTDPDKCNPEERFKLMQIVLEMCTKMPSTPGLLSDDVSLNLVWLAAYFHGGNFLEHGDWDAASEEERQLRARLHTYFGLTVRDAAPERRTAARAYVYTMRRYKWDNEFGPFMMDASGCVNWEHMQAIHHIMSMHVVRPEDLEQLNEGTFVIYPMSLPFCQSVISAELDLDKEKDWAGIAGKWQYSFCFCDHRELLVYNNLNISPNVPLHPAIFEAPDFQEIFRTIDVDMRVISFETDALHWKRPKINFAGAIEGGATMIGWVRVTPDDQIRWHFVSGEEGNAIWSSEGVQVGGVRSSFGVLGTWTTVDHAVHDPVGPFWLRKLQPDELTDATSE
ncbi:uncharacterized protein LAESUDRAFT_722920 [Laetiporus sulphureus 93-53]|uniref:F-box domain-containing protein n=1 Tax=Laetiporus sulphureus 93-53 TaxID=1314785 RepID=A0A165FMJ6_9APHY|nr:uncharacterized protein LAESUDRAFT_722920 [Laetiporus sulphureus 93-53]KZT09196.1 hypothetical protein LAESUDRAFT_722920 [Laetiporus sulphureus 93-53]